MANTRVHVPTREGVVKISAGDDSIPHIMKFLDATKSPFNSKEELRRFRGLKSDELRNAFIANWKPTTDTVPAENQPSADMALAAA